MTMSLVFSDIQGQNSFNRAMDPIVCIEDLGVHEKKYEKLVRGKIDKYSVKQGYFCKDGSIIW
jgi:hypothetical protein